MRLRSTGSSRMNKAPSMELRVYSLNELESHILADFPNPEHPCPLSPLRLQSYLKNPRAEQNDPVLFELWQKDRLVAYRSLLPDCYFDPHGNPQRFAWLSGNWVDPEFRRRGFSTKLLQEVEARWESRLMYTNYAPASKAVYDRTGHFPLLLEKNGKRFYLRAAAEELLGDRLGGQELLRFGDHAVNMLLERKLRKFESKNENLCRIERVTILDQGIREMIKRRQEQSLFRRDGDVFNWILDFPWVREEKKDTQDYHFSYKSDRFENLLLVFTLPDGSKGLLWLLLHNQALSVPYLFAESDLLYPVMARSLIQTMIAKNSAYTTIRHPLLAGHLSAHKNLFLSIRNMPQLIFAHKKIIQQVPRDMEIQDGDGDVVFTA